MLNAGASTATKTSTVSGLSLFVEIVRVSTRVKQSLQSLLVVISLDELLDVRAQIGQVFRDDIPARTGSILRGGTIADGFQHTRGTSKDANARSP